MPTMSADPNATFREGLVAQDEEAVAQLLDRYWARAYRVALQLTGDPGAAEDVAQETFVAVLKGVGSLRSGESFRGWFFKILENTAKRHHRSSYRRSAHEARSEVAPTAPAGPEDAAQQEESAQLVREHMQVPVDEGQWRIMEDTACMRGGCIVNAGHARIDASIEQQVARVAEAVLGPVGAGPVEQ